MPNKVKMENPGRFDVLPTLNDLAVRRASAAPNENLRLKSPKSPQKLAKPENAETLQRKDLHRHISVNQL